MTDALPHPFRHLLEQMPQPPLEMTMPAANAAVAMANFALLAVVAVLMLREARRTQSLIPVFCLRGPRVLLVLPLVPVAIGCAQISIAWPTWLALNSGGGPALTHAAALVSLALSMMMVYLAGEAYKGLAPAGGSTTRLPQQDVKTLDPRGVTTQARHGRA